MGTVGDNCDRGVCFVVHAGIQYFMIHSCYEVIGLSPGLSIVVLRKQKRFQNHCCRLGYIVRSFKNFNYDINPSGMAAVYFTQCRWPWLAHPQHYINTLYK